jgi:hypothetical protein
MFAAYEAVAQSLVVCGFGGGSASARARARVRARGCGGWMYWGAKCGTEWVGVLRRLCWYLYEDGE